jgi:hypothetical protein
MEKPFGCKKLRYLRRRYHVDIDIMAKLSRETSFVRARHATIISVGTVSRAPSNLHASAILPHGSSHQQRRKTQKSKKKYL